MKTYHYSRKENLTDIFEIGLKANSSYSNLGTELRKNVVYAWLSPEHDVMGYINNPDYALLELDVDESRCLVSNMDYISSAYVNSKFNDKKGDETSAMMLRLYETSSISPLNYVLGHFRTPEILIQGDVKPSKIKLIQKSESINRNIIQYNERMKSHPFYQNEKLALCDISKLNIDLVAVHDDSTGVLATFKDLERNDFITVVLSE